jgi:hypothetical protein
MNSNTARRSPPVEMGSVWPQAWNEPYPEIMRHVRMDVSGRQDTFIAAPPALFLNCVMLGRGRLGYGSECCLATIMCGQRLQYHTQYLSLRGRKSKIGLSRPVPTAQDSFLGCPRSSSLSSLDGGKSGVWTGLFGVTQIHGKESKDTSLATSSAP